MLNQNPVMVRSRVDCIVTKSDDPAEPTRIGFLFPDEETVANNPVRVLLLETDRAGQTVVFETKANAAPFPPSSWPRSTVRGLPTPPAYDPIIVIADDPSKPFPLQSLTPIAGKAGRWSYEQTVITVHGGSFHTRGVCTSISKTTSE